MKAIITDVDYDKYYLELDRSQVEFARWLCEKQIFSEIQLIDEIPWETPTSK